MSIVDGKGLVTWEGGLFEPGSDLLRRVQWAFAQIRGAGGHIGLNEAGRPFGTPSDQYARSASDTESGISTVWYQWGRYLRGETPSAADPRQGVYASEHTRGIAVDCNAPTVYDMTLRARYFAMVGMQNTISSESWHWAIRGNPSVDLAGYGNATSIQEDDSMSAQDVADLKAYIDQKQTEKLVPGGFLLQCSAPGCGIALVAPGYFNGLSGEQVEQLVPVYGMPVDCGDNKRAWDVRVAAHLQGQVPGAVSQDLVQSALEAIARLGK